MIGSIPNPVKSITVEYSMIVLKETLLNIPEIEKKYRLVIQNDVLNTYTFDADEFLSLGAYIDINITTISANQSAITLEVRRKLGSFDKAHEVTLANNHIQNLLLLLTRALQLSALEKKAILERRKALTGTLEVYEGATEYLCGFCENAFYYKENKNKFVICPTCRNTVMLPKSDEEKKQDMEMEHSAKKMTMILILFFSSIFLIAWLASNWHENIFDRLYWNLKTFIKELFE